MNNISSWNGKGITEIQQNFSNLVSAASNKESDYFKSVLDRLRSIYSAVKAQESKFFRDGQTSLTDLQMRLNICNNDPGFRQMLNTPESRIEDLIKGAIYSDGLDENSFDFIVRDERLLNGLEQICEDEIIEYTGEKAVAEIIKANFFIFVPL